MSIKAYVFDFDGTVVDSMRDWSEVMLGLLDAHRASYPSDVIKRITPLGYGGTAEYFRKTLGVEATQEELIAEMYAGSIPRYRDKILAKEGAIGYLSALRERGISFSILTASPHEMVDPCLARLGILDWFANIWTCEDLGRKKSEPEIYLEVAARLGVKPHEIAFFDDNIGSVSTAAAAGLFTVAVEDPSAAEFREELREVADLYLEKYEGFPIL